MYNPTRYTRARAHTQRARIISFTLVSFIFKLHYRQFYFTVGGLGLQYRRVRFHCRRQPASELRFLYGPKEKYIAVIPLLLKVIDTRL
jgi:hypothetical protein